MTTLEWVLGLIGCGFALWLGTSLAKKQARAYSGHPHPEDANTSLSGLPPVTCKDFGDLRFLHLGSPAVQGSMRISQPFDIHLEYMQRMMAWLLMVDLDQVHRLRAMQLGLGAASLTKFCYAQLGMHTTAVELNPRVIATCRQSFHLPDNSDKLQVLQGDAAQAASDLQWHATIDALQVDLYDQDAARPVIDTESFYNDCRQLLTPNGCMTVNLFGRASSFDESVKKITAAFGHEAVWAFKPTTAGNSIVLAFRTAPLFDQAALQTQAQAIEARWKLPATQWLSVLAPAKP